MNQKVVESLNLDNICKGALPEIFATELQRVLENIYDPNTDVDKQRSITIELKFIPFPDRSGAVTSLSVKTKLPGFPTYDSNIFIGKHNGKLVAVDKDANQRALFGEEEKPENVVDMTKKERMH